MAEEKDTDDKVFYPREDRGSNEKRLRISRVVTAPQEGDKYIMGDDNNKKSKPKNAIQKIIQDTTKEVEEAYRKERDAIMSGERFQGLDPDTYEKRKETISRYLENTKYRQLLDKTIFERISEYKSHQRHLPTVFGFSETAEPIYEDEIPDLWKTPDEMKKTQEEINDLGRKLIAKGKRLSPKFFGELENYSSDEDENNTSTSASSSSSSASPSISNSAASSSASASPSTSASTPGLKSILKRKREGGRKTKKHKKSRVRKSRVRKSKARK